MKKNRGSKISWHNSFKYLQNFYEQRILGLGFCFLRGIGMRQGRGVFLREGTTGSVLYTVKCILNYLIETLGNIMLQSCIYKISNMERISVCVSLCRQRMCSTNLLDYFQVYSRSKCSTQGALAAQRDVSIWVEAMYWTVFTVGRSRRHWKVFRHWEEA
jgi:hypothetical protein